MVILYSKLSNLVVQELCNKPEDKTIIVIHSSQFMLV